MSIVKTKASQLEPELRLARAISEFEADLSNEQKREFRNSKTRLYNSPPDLNDVNRITAEINLRISGKAGGRCYGPRFASFLQGVQQFASIGDVTIGGTQNMLACGIWSLVRMSLLAITSVSSYVEKISSLFMEIGGAVPRCEALALLYPRCKSLRSFLYEYFIVVVRLCHRILKFTQKSSFYQFTSALSDSELHAAKVDLDRWTKLIDERMTFLMATTIETEAQKSSWFRESSSKRSEYMVIQQKRAARTQILEFCSKYDHTTIWKQTRKIGNAVLFKQNTAYQSWRGRSSSCTLLCKGTLGSGKSVLLANMVDDLHIHTQNKNIKTAYFFCRYDIPESLKARTILGSLARQLLSTVPDLEMVAKICDESASAGDSEAVLKMLCLALPLDIKAYLVVDGLDECDRSEKEVLAHVIQELQKKFDLMLCISYRLEPNNGVEAVAERFAAPQSSFILDDNSDIQAFIEAELSRRLESQELVLGDPTLILKIQDALLKGSQGMFLWVALQIQSLCGMKTDQAIRDALADLPKDLAETFTRILCQSKGPEQLYQRKILQLVTVAQRPLTARDLQEALSVVPGNTVWDPSQIINDIYSVLACCGCLLMVDEEESTVRFVHHSVKQFVLGNTHGWSDTSSASASAHKMMVDIVVTYLSYGIFGTQVSTAKVPRVMTHSVPSKIIRATTTSSKTTQSIALKLLKSRTQPNFDISKTLAEARISSNHAPVDEFSFYLYATSFWWKHVTALPERTPVIDKLLSGLLSENKVSTTLSEEDRQALLWWAVRVGHEGAVKRFFRTGPINSDLDHRDSLLLWQWAQDNGQGVITELLGRSFDIGISGVKYGNALHRASQAGNLRVVKLLIDNHANVNPENGDYNPLQAASSGGHEQIVRLLTEAGADVNGCGGDIGKALYAASERGYKKVAGILLDAGADVNAVSREHGNALHAASLRGHTQVVELLLERGAHVNTQCGHYGHALQAAAHRGDMTILKLLYAHGADVNAQGGTHGSALQAASRQGHMAIVQALIERGADVNIQVGENGNALFAASEQGHSNVVGTLLDAGADINAESKYCGTALQVACWTGNLELVKLLIARGADVNQQCAPSGHALHDASYQGHELIVQLLLAAGADINAHSEDYASALQTAAYNGNTQVVQLLLNAGADVNVYGGEYGPPLQAASHKGFVQVVKLLLDAGADANAQNGYPCSALQAASREGRVRVVQLLIERGAAVNDAQGGEYSSAHRAALIGRHDQVAKVLIDNGALEEKNSKFSKDCTSARTSDEY